ncbi:ABC-F family ATP-binding cassette domain-containing protein [Lentisphaerota bacterium WC36G]|nr:ATP-binding cassette domain-containing protein [Lentisphaerae bacterium WC36]
MAEANGAVIFSADRLQLSIGIQKLLDDAAISVHANEKIGLVGRNGCGKSSFLKILASVGELDEGNIIFRNNIKIGYLPQEFAIDETKTIYENIESGAAEMVALLAEYENNDTITDVRHHEIEQILNNCNGWDLNNQIEQLVVNLKIPDVSRPAKELSGGEKRRVALAKTLIGKPDLLLLDEPTNHLDTESIEWLEGYLNNTAKCCIIITHDRYFLDRVCNRIVELSFGQFYSYDGNYSDFMIQKAEREHALDRQHERREKFLRAEIEWVRKSPKARTARNQGRLKKFFEVAAEKAPPKDYDVQLVIPEASKLGNKIVNLENVSIMRGEKQLLKDFSYEFEKGCKIGIVGPNGCGKTTLLSLITGNLAANDGTVFVADTVEFNYIDQQRVQLNNELTVFEEIGEGNDYVEVGNHKVSVWTYLKRFLFTDERIKTMVGYLSGGERARLALAKIIKKGGNFLILDEPTNDLDLSTLRMLEEALVEYTGCLIIVSHDRYFLNRICDSIIAFEGDENPIFEVGNYDYYKEKFDRRQKNKLAQIQAKQAQKTSQSVKNNANNDKNDGKKVRKLKWKEERELESIEEEILLKEDRVSEIEELFSMTDFFEKYGDSVADLQSELTTLNSEIEGMYSRWEFLESIKNGEVFED